MGVLDFFIFVTHSPFNLKILLSKKWGENFNLAKTSFLFSDSNKKVGGTLFSMVDMFDV